MGLDVHLYKTNQPTIDELKSKGFNPLESDNELRTLWMKNLVEIGYFRKWWSLVTIIDSNTYFEPLFSNEYFDINCQWLDITDYLAEILEAYPTADKSGDCDDYDISLLADLHSTLEYGERLLLWAWW